jgi:hypothetical protein
LDARYAFPSCSQTRIAIAARMPMMTTTIRSSTVKPFESCSTWCSPCPTGGVMERSGGAFRSREPGKASGGPAAATLSK